MLLLLNQPWLYLATTVFAVLLGIYVWKRPEQPGIRQFRWIIIVWMVWALAAALQTIIQSPPVNYWLWVFQSLCGLAGVSLELLMTLAYTGSEDWITRGRAYLLFIPATLFLFLAIFKPEMITTIDLNSANPVFLASSLTMWGFVGYAFVLIVIMLGALFASLLRAPAFRIPILMIILGKSLAALGYLTATRLNLVVSPIQITSVLINLVMLSYFVAFFNYRLLQVVPVARDTVVAHMPFALLVLDAENYLVDINAVAKALPGMPRKLKLQQPAEKALGSWWAEITDLIGPEEAAKDAIIQTGLGERIYRVRSMPLLQSSGWRIGQAFVLEDITLVRQAQIERAHLQWAKATLEERELLADELHDSFSQNLAFLNLQAQAAQLYFQSNNEQAAQTSLSRLAEAVGQIQADTREMIDHLLSVSVPTENFCVTLQQMLTNFETQTGLATQLCLEGDAAKDGCCNPTSLPPSVAVQLVRITQEALTNVRKHARGSSRVQVQLNATEKLMEMTIKDDGKGFDPETNRTNGKHFGLQIMRQRAARIGGQVKIDSTPGEGTMIEVSVPLGSTKPGIRT